MEELTVISVTGFGLHSFKTGFWMVVFTAFFTSILIEFFQAKFFELGTHFWVSFSAIFPEFTLVGGVEVAYVFFVSVNLFRYFSFPT